MTFLKKQAHQCMRWAWGTALVVLLAPWAAWSQPATSPVVVLDERTNLIEGGQVTGWQWIDGLGTAALEQVLPGKASWQPLDPEAIHTLGARSALWMRIRVSRPRDSTKGWLLEFPLPLLDQVTLHQQDSYGRWIAQTGGDTVAVDQWPEPGRYPFFRLQVPPGESRDLYVRIRHLTAVSVPVSFVSESAHDRRLQTQYLGLGVVFGGLILLIAACLAQSRVYRDVTYAWYAAYAGVITLAVGAYTGVAGHLVWPGSGVWADTSQGVLALLAAGAAMLFVRDLSGIAARLRLLDRAVLWAGFAGLVLAAVYMVVERSTGVMLIGGYLLLACFTSFLIAYLAWRRGDVVGLWVLLAYTPLGVAVTLVLARIFGLAAAGWVTQYAVVAAMALQVPLLLVALNLRSRERHGTLIRELALSTQDALTGLLAPHLFNDRLRQVTSRYRRDREDAAVVFIDLVNYNRIKEFHGQPVAEQSLLRSVIKLRRLVRDVDTAARVGESRFALILEGVSARASVTDRVARLIAAGLMPLKGLTPEVTLQFHAAAVILSERLMEPQALTEALDELLASMSQRTRRPIRFIEPEITRPLPLDAGDSVAATEEDSSLPKHTRPPVAS
jgi:diguanylate cyclase (GGDEF)-like protein